MMWFPTASNKYLCIVQLASINTSVFLFSSCWLVQFPPHLANCRCRRTASPQWGRSSRGRGSRSCSYSKGCRKLPLSSICRIRSTLCWRLSYQACTFHDQNSCWDKSWSWKKDLSFKAMLLETDKDFISREKRKSISKNITNELSLCCSVQGSTLK